MRSSFLPMMIRIASCLSMVHSTTSFVFSRTASNVASRHRSSRTTTSRVAILEGIVTTSTTTTTGATKLYSSGIRESETSTESPKTSSLQQQQQQQNTKMSSRRRRKEEQERLGKSQTELSWETYDYSLNPKKDHRFSDDEELNVEEEALEDERHAQKLREKNDAYSQLEPELVSKAIAALEPWINQDRLDRISGVLKQRTKHSKFLFENPSNPSNVWACLRTIDSFGMQNVDVVIESGMYAGKMAISQKKGMRTAMGSAQWLTLTNHHTTKQAIETIRAQGFKIYASDLNPNSRDVREIDWDADDRPICIVMGNEDRGISQEMRELADETFTLPMSGFAESFNLSVATSITLAHMSARSYDCDQSEGQRKGPLRPGDLSEHEYNCLYLKGLLHSLPQKRMSKALLKQANVNLPEALGDL